MKVKIKDTEITLHYTMRMYMNYENITGGTIDFNNFTSLNQLIILFLSCILASAKKDNIDLQLDYEEFMDWLDEQGGNVILTDFTIWLTKQLQAEKLLMMKEDISDTEEAIRKSKTKTKKKV